MWKLVENKDRRFGSATHYLQVGGPGGQPLLFTYGEVLRAEQRARGNPEDVGQRVGKSWWRRLLESSGLAPIRYGEDEGVRKEETP